ncbi:MAG: carbamate kinase [Candidatus Wallbacteria bacterium GWC2_49_35]|uniref:Carbamate kinase n=1 Tax=Candidatus Wallbacteria bacterium GWC2_49_35 TaxID=1817813 RepID=A0A1F7WZB2_9BACT|nr:MAG: carbamate kinase [Candidatus Wallbacteria bacterium GWC2_49_35]HBC76649.1 carbamate kinase [Candidatus Wallbacteria bacterium]
MKKAVIAVGGNSLIKDKDHQSVPDQYLAVCETVKHVAGMVEKGYNVVMTHGNGPQVGFILRRSEISRTELHEVPLDSCGADTQGAIGYQIQQAFYNEFKKRGIKKNVVTVVTQVLVDKNDEAFKKPTKPIGSFMSKEDADKKVKEEGWNIKEDAGRGYRRVVASPMPKEIVEIDAVKKLIDSDFIVVAVGGGGIPVIATDKGELKGTAAVIDKDFASALLAAEIKADIFMITTGVEKVCINYNKPDQKTIDKMSLAEAEKYLAEGQFPAGSMGPKIQAAIMFLKNGGETVIITSPEFIEKAINGQTGTVITK